MYIRIAHSADLERIVEIYNQAVAGGFMTADTEPWVAEEKKAWFEGHTEHEYPIYVAVKDENVVGWLSLSGYRPGRNALKHVKEVSYYVDHSHLGHGIGGRLMEHALYEAPYLHVKHYLAILLDANTASVKLLKKYGFKEWGHLPGIAEFSGKVCGHLYYGLTLTQE